jgi:two-component sensor histidine kinase
VSAASESRPMSESVELRELFHRLSNQLGVILAHAELLQAKAPDDAHRARAAHVVNAALEAMTTAREIRQQIPSSPTEKVGA